MDYMELFNILSNGVFPIGVCAFLLWDKKTRDEKLNDTINNFSLTIAENTAMLKQLMELIKSVK